MRLGVLLVLGVAACGGREAGSSTAPGSTLGVSGSHGTAATISTSHGNSTFAWVASTSSGTVPDCSDFGRSLPSLDPTSCSVTGACTPGMPVCLFYYGSGLPEATCACMNGTWSCTALDHDAAVCAGTAGDADAVTTDGAVCASGELACPVPCCSPKCWGETKCFEGTRCPPPLLCPP
jgi:hypothetical protein